MYFTSYEFIAFAAVLIFLYYILPKCLQKPLLLLASLLFVCSYGVQYLPFILVTAVTSWGAALMIDREQQSLSGFLKEHKAELTREEKKAKKDQSQRHTRAVMTVCLVINIGILCFLKYANFTIHNINAIFSIAEDEKDLFLDLFLPIGISFYTFMCSGYVIDIFREKYRADRNFMNVLLFASYFPSLVQGPFSKYDELGKTLFVSHGYDPDAVKRGLLRVVFGYFKKLVLADRVVIALNTLIGAPDEYRGAYVFAGIILYSLRIYADFTGGIDITLGISEMLGIKLPENFCHPYFSKSIAEYWRRWHISLGDWFREYLFYPLSTWSPINKLAKKLKPSLGAGFAKRLPVYFSTILVWFVTGFWHGASWNFISWGMANCIVILISQELSPLYAKFHKRTGIGEDGVYGAFMMLRTYLLMSCIRMFDCYATVPETLSAFGSMFTTANAHVLFDGSMLKLGLEAHDFIVLLVGSLFLFTVSVLDVKRDVRERLASRTFGIEAAVVVLLILVIVFGNYGIGYDSAQFIYNQF